MSEMVEIEIGANLGKFHAAMAKVRASLGGIKAGLGDVSFKSAEQGLTKLGESAKKSKADASDVLGLFKSLGSTKVSPRTVKDLQEVFKELLRILKEIGPIITLAMNAFDQPLRKAIGGFAQMLTKVERANSNFLILRKVLPMRLFGELFVATTRIQTSVLGMAKDFVRFGTGAKDALTSVFSGTRKVGTALSDSAVSAKTFTGSLGASVINKVGQAFEGISQRAAASGIAFKNATSISGGLTNAYKVLTMQVKKSVAENDGLTASQSKLTGNSKGLIASLKGIGLSLAKSLKGLMGAKGLSIAAAGAFTALAGAAKLAGRGLIGLTSRGAVAGMRALASSAKQAVPQITRIGKSVAKIATKPISSATSAVGKLGSAFTKVSGGVGIAIAAITAVGGILASVADGAVAKFNKNWRKTMSEIPNATEGMTVALKKDMQDLQMEMGIVSEDALPALAIALKKGFTAGNSVDLLKQAAMLAKTEVTDLNGAVDIIGNSMRAFAGEGMTAAEATDALFVASKQGGMSFQEMAGSLKRVAPEIAKTGLGFKEFLGSLAVLNKQGKTTISAMGGIQKLATAIVSPSEKSAAAFAKLGLSFTKADMAGKGLGQILAEVKAATGGNVAQMAELLGGQENLNIALNVGAKNGELLKRNMDGLRNGTGKVADESSKMETSFQTALKKISVKVEFLKVELSKMLQPAIKAIGAWLSSWINKITMAVKIAHQLFKNGDLGKVLLDGVIVGVGNMITVFQKAFVGISRGLAESFAAAFIVFPTATKGAVQNMLARLAKIAFFFVDLGGKMIAAFNKPIAYLQAGLIWAIESAAAALSKLPIIGDGGKTKARAFEVILKEKIQEGAGKKFGDAQQGVAKGLNDKADAIIAKTQRDLDKVMKGVGAAFKKGFEEGADGVKQDPAIAKREAQMHEKIKAAMDQVNKIAEDAKKNAEDAIIGQDAGQVGDVLASALGDANKVDGGSIVASSLAAIGGGGGVFGTQEQLIKKQIGVQEEQLKVQKLVVAAVNKINLGEVKAA